MRKTYKYHKSYAEKYYLVVTLKNITWYLSEKKLYTYIRINLVEIYEERNLFGKEIERRTAPGACLEREITQDFLCVENKEDAGVYIENTWKK